MGRDPNRPDTANDGQPDGCDGDIHELDFRNQEYKGYSGLWCSLHQPI